MSKVSGDEGFNADAQGHGTIRRCPLGLVI